MSRRTVAKFEGPAGSSLRARVVRDSEWEEFIVEVHREGARPFGDYHTSDKADALGTAQAMLADLHAVAVQPLPPGALEALQAFATAHGRGWREALRGGWYRAHYDRVSTAHGAALQGLRNHAAYGPGSSWLDAFALPEEVAQ